MEVQTILSIILGGGNVATLVAFLGERKKRKAEANVTQANALESMQKVYDTFVKDSESNYKKLEQKYQEIWMRCETHAKKIEDQEKTIKSLDQKIKKYEKKCINNCGA